MKVLVVDDEPQIRRALKVILEKHGHEAILASSGEEGLDLAATSNPDLLILDLAMPGTDGFEVCKQVRSWSKVPIIVLSARDNEESKIKALDLGADDYLTKPFGGGELLARLRALMRRADAGPEGETPTLIFDELLIDQVHRKVTVDGEEVHLTPTEYQLLCYMAKNPDRVLTHAQLLSKVWGPECAEDHHTLRVHIGNLRNKIESQPERPKFIHTEIRVGYRFISGTT